VRHCGLSASDAALWDSALGNEQARCQRPAYIVQMKQQQHGHRLLSSSHVGGVTPPADDDGSQVVTELVEQPQEQQVAAGDGGTDMDDEVHYQVLAAEAEPEKLHQPEQAGDVSAATPAHLVSWRTCCCHSQRDKPLDIYHPAVHSGKDAGLSAGAAAAEAQEEPPEERCPWYENQELRRVFADMPIGSPHSFDDGWFWFETWEGALPC
jgi:hypothetical protein